MKTVLLYLLSLLVFFVSCQTRTPSLSQGDIQEIRQIEQEFAKAYIAGDINGMLECRTNDIVWMSPGSPALEGKSALRKAFNSSTVQVIGFIVTPIHTAGHGGMAYNRGTFTTTSVIEGDTTQEQGKYVQIWRLQDDGSWRIALDIFNINSTANSTGEME